MDISGLDELDLRELRFNDAGGDHVFTITDDTNDNIVLESKVQDKDIVFKGNDNGSVITAMTIDMSEAGKVYFDADIDVGSGTIRTIISTGDILNTGTLYSDAGINVATGTLTIDSSGNISTTGTLDCGAITSSETQTITKDTDGEFVALVLTNQSDAANTTGIVSLRFDLKDTAGNTVDSGKIAVKKNESFTSTAATQDSNMVFSTSLNGTLTERMTINNDGKVEIEEKLGINIDPDTYRLWCNGTARFEASVDFIAGFADHSSDDRVKENEVLITGAVSTLQKLRPQIYDKKPTFDSTDISSWYIQSGLIAQEVYYDAPELRHLVSIPEGVTPDDSIETSTDPSVDPDYSSWGDDTAGLKYTGFIAYLITAVQELKVMNDNLTSRIEALENP